MSDKSRIARVAHDTRTILDRAIFNLGNKDVHGEPQAPHLGGLCGMASVFLADELAQHRFAAQIAQAEGHYFVVSGPWIVDITATQFGQAPVVVRDFMRTQEQIVMETRQMYWWMARRLFNSVEEAGITSYRDDIIIYKDAAKGKK